METLNFNNIITDETLQEYYKKEAYISEITRANKSLLEILSEGATLTEAQRGDIFALNAERYTKDFNVNSLNREDFNKIINLKLENYSDVFTSDHLTKEIFVEGLKDENILNMWRSVNEYSGSDFKEKALTFLREQGGLSSPVKIVKNGEVKTELIGPREILKEFSNMLDNKEKIDNKIYNHYEIFGWKIQPGSKVTRILTKLVTDYIALYCEQRFKEHIINKIYEPKSYLTPAYLSIEPFAFIHAGLIGSSCLCPEGANQHGSFANFIDPFVAVAYNKQFDVRAWVILSKEHKLFSMARTYGGHADELYLQVYSYLTNLGYTLVTGRAFYKRTISMHYIDTSFPEYLEGKEKKLAEIFPGEDDFYSRGDCEASQKLSNLEERYPSVLLFKNGEDDTRLEYYERNYGDGDNYYTYDLGFFCGQVEYYDQNYLSVSQFVSASEEAYEDERYYERECDITGYTYHEDDIAYNSDIDRAYHYAFDRDVQTSNGECVLTAIDNFTEGLEMEDQLRSYEDLKEEGLVLDFSIKIPSNENYVRSSIKNIFKDKAIKTETETTLDFTLSPTDFDSIFADFTTLTYASIFFAIKRKVNLAPDMTEDIQYLSDINRAIIELFDTRELGYLILKGFRKTN